MISIFLEIGLAIIVFFLCLFTHEIGHAISIKAITGKNPKLKIKNWIFKLQYDYKNKISNNQEIFILTAVISLWILPLLVFADFLHFFTFIIILIGYLVGSGFDIKRLIKLRRKTKRWGF